MDIYNVYNAKKELRAKCRRITKSLNENYIKEASIAIVQNIIAMDEYKQAETIFCYLNAGGEPMTERFIKIAQEEGKKVGIPLCTGPHEMVVKEYKSGDELTQGAYGIREPLDKAREITAAEIDLAIIPCVSCSRDLRRIGHGAGYYDRFIENSGFTKLAICFEKLIMDEIPVEDTDVRMDFVVTETQIYGLRWR